MYSLDGICYRVNLEEYGFNQSALPTAQPVLHQGANKTTQAISDAATNSTTLWLDMVMSRDTCVYIFSAITGATVIVTLFRSFLFFYTCMRASRRLHDTMFNSITRATMYFFNTNSSGMFGEI